MRKSCRRQSGEGVAAADPSEHVQVMRDVCCAGHTSQQRSQSRYPRECQCQAVDPQTVGGVISQPGIPLARSRSPKFPHDELLVR